MHPGCSPKLSPYKLHSAHARVLAWSSWLDLLVSPFRRAVDGSRAESGASARPSHGVSLLLGHRLCICLCGILWRCNRSRACAAAVRLWAVWIAVRRAHLPLAGAVRAAPPGRGAPAFNLQRHEGDQVLNIYGGTASTSAFNVIRGRLALH